MNADRATDAVVFIVDDDRRIREALCDLLASFDLEAIAFASAGEYLAYDKPDVPSCMLLDVELPDINGLDLQSQLVQGGHPHVVFVTGHADVPSSVRAMKTGAVDFLTKPLVTEDLMRAIDAALTQNRESRKKRAHLAELHQRWALLTPREREALAYVVSGFLNKQAAAALGISEVTMQIHRGSIMRKMDAASLADLVRMAESLGVAVIPRAR